MNLNVDLKLKYWQIASTKIINTEVDGIWINVKNLPKLINNNKVSLFN